MYARVWVCVCVGGCVGAIHWAIITSCQNIKREKYSLHVTGFSICCEKRESPLSTAYDCWPAWPDLAKFRHFDKTLQVFGKYLTLHFLFGKLLGQLRQIYYIIGQIFVVANGQILKNNLTIWSHWLEVIRSCSVKKRPKCAMTKYSLIGIDVMIQCDQIGRFCALKATFSKPLATINLPKSPTFLGNFCKGVKIYHFSIEIILGQLL